MKHTFNVPPALWWRQSQAARLEARRLSPSPPDETMITVRRTGIWRPDKPAQFEATYELGAMQEEPERRFSAGNIGLGAATAVAIVLAASSTIVKRDAVSPTPPLYRPGEAAIPSITQHALISKMIGDLSEIGRRTSGANINRLSWTPDQIEIETDAASAPKIRQALAGSEQTARIIVSPPRSNP